MVGADVQTPQDIESPASPRSAEGPGKMLQDIPCTCADTSLKSWDPFKELAENNKWRRVKAREMVLPQQRQEKKPFKARLQWPVLVPGCPGSTEPSARGLQWTQPEHTHEKDLMLQTHPPRMCETPCMRQERFRQLFIWGVSTSEIHWKWQSQQGQITLFRLSSVLFLCVITSSSTQQKSELQNQDLELISHCGKGSC